MTLSLPGKLYTSHVCLHFVYLPRDAGYPGIFFLPYLEIHILAFKQCYLPILFSTMDEQIRQKYRQRLHRESQLASNNECIIWTGFKRNYNGVEYGQINTKITVGGGWRTLHVHRLSYLIKHNILEPHGGLEASHLCHNSLCINPDHISLEPHFVNNNRRFCKNFQKCTGHGFNYPNCMLNLTLS